MMTKSNHPSLCLKFNNLITDDPCRICGGRCQPTAEAAYNLFLEGTRALVCDACGWEHAPELMYVIECVGFVESLSLPTRNIPKHIHEEIERRLCNAPGGEINTAPDNGADFLEPLPF